DVVDAERLEHGTHRTASNDAGTWRRRAQDHSARAMASRHIVMQGAALAKRHTHEIALCAFGCLADGLRHLARLAVTETDPTLLVADNDERGEAEAFTALHPLGHAIDVHELVDKLAVALTLFAISPATSTWSTFSHIDPLEIKAALAGRLCQRLH